MQATTMEHVVTLNANLWLVVLAALNIVDVEVAECQVGSGSL